jgi:uncharacterized protein DUF3891
MMVQTAPEGGPHFVLTMLEHLDFCGQLGRAFGNDNFQPLEPRSEAIYAVENHDRGWDAYDANPKLDPETGLPYSLVRTPQEDSLKTITGSPDFAERHHPYCGVLVSMHTWGLHNRRYGFSQFVVRQRTTTSITVSEAHKAEAQARLARELERQERLKAVVAADSKTRSWVEPSRLMQNYKQLQFFDTLGLYFHLRQEAERGEEVYIHVPQSAEADTNVSVRSLGQGRYSLTPFPFANDNLKVICRGRYVRPIAAAAAPGDLGAALRSISTDSQTYTLVAG